MANALNATRTKNAAILAQIKQGEALEAARNARLAGLAKAAAEKAAALGRVRALENLRQLNGNPKPQYSMEERFRKEQGTIIVQAFVTAQGSLKDFKLVQSTGYKNLDAKTLAALRKWRFYPGQEGWVEIPQTWNIKGEAEEMPATLRRKISQR
jgi:TonB family protein